MTPASTEEKPMQRFVGYEDDQPVFEETSVPPDPSDPQDVKEGLQYIADSPPQEYGGFHDEAIRTAQDAISLISQLESELAEAKSEAAKQFLQLSRREKEAFDNGIRASQLDGENARLRAEIEKDHGFSIDYNKLLGQNASLRSEITRLKGLVLRLRAFVQWFQARDRNPQSNGVREDIAALLAECEAKP